ncbi:hypothetical protein HS088_TW03G00528 [Tripterygium wilfordii]|uniref:ABC1 atypical kinase-like domain-containing protein n=1 Tax=Tripterygium wilfordii TaxID=458696 RepID=A0A7J7DV03_TRIWF|nr:hypothetical protein HS088_TW03G00528 [Tripterygium wilfordii]
MVRVPRVYWELTTSHVLTMEFCRGQKVDDVGFLREMKINPTKVAKALVEIFAEMIFIHGFVHGDPHPGNILVSPEGPNGFTLVLLDHGIYRQLDEGFQQDYCKLWKALILLDSNEIRHLSERFGVGNYYRYFPLIFTGQPIDSKSALGRVVSTEEKNKIKQEFKSVKMEDISSFMESLPPDFLRILRTDGLLRSIMRKLGAPQQVRLLAYAKYAIYGLSLNLNQESEFVAKIAFSRLKANLSYLRLRLLLGSEENHKPIPHLYCTITDAQTQRKAFRSSWSAARPATNVKDDSHCPCIRLFISILVKLKLKRRNHSSPPVQTDEGLGQTR